MDRQGEHRCPGRYEDLFTWCHLVAFRSGNANGGNHRYRVHGGHEGRGTPALGTEGSGHRRHSLGRRARPSWTGEASCLSGQARPSEVSQLQLHVSDEHSGQGLVPDAAGGKANSFSKIQQVVQGRTEKPPAPVGDREAREIGCDSCWPVGTAWAAASLGEDGDSSRDQGRMSVACRRGVLAPRGQDA